MSIGVSGMIYADTEDINYKVQLSFYFEQIANEKKIGSKLGGNVSKEVYNNYYDLREEYSIIFELLDTPLDNCAQELFAPNMYGGEAISLAHRMQKVQNLIEKVLNYEQVTKVILDINYLDGIGENIIKIDINNFKNEVVKLYEPIGVFPPVVRLIIE